MAVTRTTHIVVGSNNFCQQLDNEIREHTITATVPGQSEIDNVAEDHIDLLPHSVQSEITVPTLYYSDLSKALASRRNGFVFAMWDGYSDEFGTATPVFEGGDSLIDGIPETAPSTDAISNSFTARPRRAWVRGTKAFEFTLRQGGLSFTVPGTFENTEKVFLLVTAKGDSTSRTLTLTAGSKNTTQAVTVPAVHELDISGFDGGNLSSATLATTGLTGANSTITGWLLIGSPYERPA